MGPEAVQLLTNSSFAAGFCLGEACNSFIRPAKIRVPQGKLGVQSQSLEARGNRLVRLAGGDVDAGQTIEGQNVMRVHFGPQLVSFDRLLKALVRVFVIVRLNIELLSLTDMLTSLKRLPQVFVGKIRS
jgi:hypothetical protein